MSPIKSKFHWNQIPVLLLFCVLQVLGQYSASCVIQGTPNDPTIGGVITFSQTSPTDLVTVNIQANGITQNLNSPHGVHIHEFGDLGTALSVGAHFDPSSSPHGCPETNGTARQYGDMGNWNVSPTGTISQSKQLNLLTLSGFYSIIGRAVVIHSAADNCVSITSSGSRSAFCVIGIQNQPNNQASNGANSINFATCVLQPSSGSSVNGTVWFSQPLNQPTTVYAAIQGITGVHAFHLHQFGDISASDGTKTGGHYNPLGTSHGIPSLSRHVGDMGVISFYGPNQVAFYQYTNNLISLTGPNNIIGRAIHVHANPDDCTDPSGGGGARIAQCVVGITSIIYPNLPPNVPQTQDPTPCLNNGMTNPFPRCFTVNTTLIGRAVLVCVNLQFQNCQFDVSVAVDNKTVYHPPTYSVAQLKAFLQDTEVCRDGPIPGCQTCVKWSNVTLDSTAAGGCGSYSFKCLGIPIGPYSIGCFRDTQVIPRCFGGCKNSCSFNGLCNNGVCQCQPYYGGDDCSVFNTNCPSNCGGPVRGTCSPSGCVCNTNFFGQDCLTYRAESTSESEGNSWKTFVIVFLVLLVVVGVAIGVGYLLYRRRQLKPTAFEPLTEESTQLELDE